jgi:hypothetical protein
LPPWLSCPKARAWNIEKQGVFDGLLKQLRSSLSLNGQFELTKKKWRGHGRLCHLFLAGIQIVTGRTSFLAILFSAALTFQSKAEVVLANTSAANGDTKVNINIKFSTTALSYTQALKSLKLYGDTGQTITANFGYYNFPTLPSQSLTGLEIGATGQYLFDISTLQIGTYTTNGYALEIRSLVANGAGIKTATSGTSTYNTPNYSLTTYDGANIKFELSTTAVPEPGTFILGSIAAACGGGGVWWRRRKNTKEMPAVDAAPKASV